MPQGGECGGSYISRIKKLPPVCSQPYSLTGAAEMLTRAQIKAQRESLWSLCSTIVGESRQDGFYADTTRCVSAYIKLSEYRAKLAKLRDNDALTDSPADFVKAEELDRQCLTISERLYDVIPSSHALKKRSEPLHLGLSEVGAGDGNRASSRSKKPKVPEFDGKNSAWVWWKIVFENEVNQNSELSSDQKFCHLLKSIKSSTFAHKIVVNYAGVKDAYKRAWEDLVAHYKSTSDVKSSHLQGLRDLSSKLRVTSDDDIRRLENLYQTAWGHVNALESLGTDVATYQPLAIMGVREALPSSLRVKFLLEHTADDFSETCFKELFQFLKDELQARRRARRMVQEQPAAQRKEKERKFVKREPKDRPRQEERSTSHKTKKQSSMLQDDQEESLNE